MRELSGALISENNNRAVHIIDLFLVEAHNAFSKSLNS